MKIVSVGEILWDLVEGREFLGGAPLNFALHAARLGHQALMVSAVGDDDRGLRSLAEISARALRTDFISRVPGHPTGTVTVKMSHHGLPDYVIHRPAAYDFPVLDAAALNSLASPLPDWIYFGTLQQLSPAAHEVLKTILAAAPHARNPAATGHLRFGGIRHVDHGEAMVGDVGEVDGCVRVAAADVPDPVRADAVHRHEADLLAFALDQRLNHVGASETFRFRLNLFSESQPL